MRADPPAGMLPDNPGDLVVLGKLGGTFGIKGWLHVRSFTSPADNLISYAPWFMRTGTHQGWQAAPDHVCRPHKKGFIAKFAGVDDPQTAQRWTGSLIAVAASVLPEITATDEYYWRDLVGCEVRNSGGEVLGVVQRMLETGANDVLCIKVPAHGASPARELLIPFVGSYIVDVDPHNRMLVVDWQADW